MNPKPWWKSKTLWFNILTFGVAAASGQLGIPIPPSIAVPVVTIGNIGLRLISNQPITATGDSLLRAILALAQTARTPQPMPSHVHDTSGQEQGPFPQPVPSHSSVDRSQWDRREDGSAKGDGFLGLLARPDGAVSSEISAGFDGLGPGGAEAEIPTVVPTLSPAEIDYLLNMNVSRDKLPQSIVEKAIAYAKQRRAQGKPYFAGPGEANYAIDPQFKRVQ